MRWVVLFLLCIAPLAASAGEGYLPEEYRPFWLGHRSSEAVCLRTLPLLNIEKAYGMDDIGESFGGRGAPALFKDAIANARNSGKELEKAKNSSTINDWTTLWLTIRLYTDDGAATVTSVPFQCFAADYFDIAFCARAERSACKGLEHSRNAILLSSKASNEAREATFTRLEELRRMGAGCAGYSGSERGTYERAERLFSGALPEPEFPLLWRYDNQNMRLSATLLEANYVRRGFDAEWARFEDPDAFSKSIVLASGGSENLVTGWLNTYWQIDDAIKGMQEKYNASLAGYSLAEASAEKRHKELEKDGYYFIDKFLLTRLSEASPSEIKGVRDARTPSEKLGGARMNISEASLLSLQAGALVGKKGECYLANGISLLKDAEQQLLEADSSMREIEESVRGMEESARLLCLERLASLEGRISSFQANSSASARLKSRAQKELAEQRALFDKAREKNIGERLDSYAGLLKLSSSTLLLLSDENASLEGLRETANSTVLGFCELVELAKKDGLETRLEEIACKSMKERLEFGTREDLASLQQEAGSLESVLFSKAELRFGYLDGKISSLRSAESALRAYSPLLRSASSLLGKISEFNTLAMQYGEGDCLLPRKALGSYLKIEEKLLSLELLLENSKSELISEILEKTAVVRMSEEEAILGKEFEIHALISLSNPFPFGTDSAVSLSISLPEEAKGCSFPGENSSSAQVLLHSVPAQSAHTFSVSGNCGIVAFAEGNPISKVLSLSPDALDAQTSFSFRTERSLRRLRVPVRILGSPSLLFAETDGAFLEDAYSIGGGSAEVLLSNVRKGSGRITLLYSIFTPYSISAGEFLVENVTNRTSRTSFTVRAVSNGLELKDALVQFQIPGQNISSSAVSITPLGGARISNFSATPFQGGTLLSWKVNRIPAGGSAEFEISYEFEDAEGYSLSLLSLARERLSDVQMFLSVEKLSELRESLFYSESLISEEKFTQAIPALQALVAEIDDSYASALLLAEAQSSLLEAQESLKSRISLARSIAYSLESGGIAQSSEAEECAFKAQQSLERADFFSEASELEEALALSAKASSQLDECLRSCLSSAISELSNEAQSVSSPLAQEHLSNARLSLASFDCEGAVSSLSQARLALDASFAEREGLLSGLALEAEIHQESFALLKEELRASLEAFSRASTLTEGRAPTDSETKKLSNETLERDAKASLREMDSLDSFFIKFSSSERLKFASENQEAISALGARLSSLNSTLFASNSAIDSYWSSAEASCNEAEMRLSQVKEIAPPSEQYAQLLLNHTSSVEQAKAALSEKRYADAIILSEKANSALGLMLYGITQVEVEGAGEGTPLYLFALPVVAFALLGYLYFRKKPEKKGLKVIKRLD